MFTQESFCNIVWGSTYQKIDGSYNKDDYVSFTIPKKGGVRQLYYLPKESTLYRLQNKLLRNYLSKVSLPTCVIGFRRNESYHSYLTPHVGNKHFLRVDIKNFFPSISKKLIATEIKTHLSMTNEEETNAIIALISDIVTLNGSLPQGASTSPAISNIVMARLDQRILKYCQVFDISYTRYADDLLFSSKHFNFSQKNWFFRKVKHILCTNGFEVNYSKLKHANNEISLNGYVIAGREIRLSRKRLSDIRHIISLMKQKYDVLLSNGEQDFLKTINSMSLIHRDLNQHPFTSLFSLIQYLCGYRAFLISWIDRNQNTAFQKELKHLVSRIEKVIIQFS